jgi:carbonic anhydrase
MTVIDELLENAKGYAESFDKPELPMPPARKVAVVACMDARLNPYGLLGLEEGDAHVIRNAGGVITDDEIRSLASATSRTTCVSRSPASRRARSSRART